MRSFNNVQRAKELCNAGKFFSQINRVVIQKDVQIKKANKSDVDGLLQEHYRDSYKNVIDNTIQIYDGQDLKMYCTILICIDLYLIINIFQYIMRAI